MGTTIVPPAKTTTKTVTSTVQPPTNFIPAASALSTSAAAAHKRDAGIEKRDGKYVLVVLCSHTVGIPTTTAVPSGFVVTREVPGTTTIDTVVTVYPLTLTKYLRPTFIYKTSFETKTVQKNSITTVTRTAPTPTRTSISVVKTYAACNMMNLLNTTK